MAAPTLMNRAAHAIIPQLVIENVCVTFDDLEALKDLSFSVNRGELVGIIGPNGAGKSTLVNSICGHQTIDSGRIVVGQDSVSPLNIVPGLVGLVPQEIALYESLTAEENLIFFARAAGFGKADAKLATEQALASVQLTTHKEKLINTLSGGMKRRVNFAAAILTRPALLILDEPTAGVDAAARDEVMALAAEHARQGMTILLISHELDQIERYCDRVLVLNGGRCQHFAAPQDVLRTVFGTAQELRFQTEHLADAALHKRMIKSNLVHHPADQCWTGFCRTDPTAVSQSIYAMVSEHNNAVREMTIRKPGLDLLIQSLARAGTQ